MTAGLARLLRPRSLAFIGGEAAERAIDATRSFGFQGDMWAVNPRRQLRDVVTLASASELPEGVDAAFVGVGRHEAAEVVRELATRGTGAAVCYASGYAEIGEAGAACQRELVEAAAGMPLVGPNCYGTLSAVTGAALWPDLHGLVRAERGVAIVSQSGNIALNLTMQRRGLEITHVISLGNQAGVGLAEVFEALVADPAVTGVGLYIEAIDDIARFAASADEARRRGLPVVVLKAGASEEAEAISVSHTGSLVGSDDAYEALFRRLGARRARTVGGLLDLLGVLSVVGPLAGNRLVSLSCSGGEAALVADRGRNYQVAFPAFAPDHRDRVAATLDGRVAVTNPLDYHTFIWGDSDRLTECFTTVLNVEPRSLEAVEGARSVGASKSVDAQRPFDAALLVLDFPAAGLDRSRWWPTLEAFGAACAASGTPGVLVASMAENLPDEARGRAADLGLAACCGFDNALAAIEAASALRCPPADALPPDTSRLLLSPRSPTSTRALSEHEAKQWLAKAGVDVPPGRLVPAGDAAAAAAEIGCPVVVKATGLAHKSDVGGVAVGLAELPEVAAAATRLGALGSGTVLVEAHIEDAVAELMVSVRSAPPVGMLLTLGAGGTLVELLDDFACLLLPTGPKAVREALRSLKFWPLLDGHRGRPSAAVDAVVEAVDCLGSLVRDDGDIIEVEVNPLLVTAQRAIAADALIVVASPPERRPK